jgi:hypothetical protein
MDAIPGTLKVQWRAGNGCNFHCGYCHPSLYSGSEPYRDYYTLKQGLLNLKDSTGAYDFVDIELQGGEPTISEEIRLLITKKISPKFKYTLHTNASADIGWWQQSISLFEKLVLAWHPKVNDNHFKHVVELAKENKVDYGIVINADHTDESWSRAVEMFEYFTANQHYAQFKTLFSNYQKGNDKFMPYTNEQWAYYLKVNRIPEVQINEVEVKLYDNYLGNLCWAGVDQIVIDYHGNVFRGWCHSGGVSLGNIYTNAIELINTPSVCPMSLCKNAFDKQAKKSKNSWGM